VGLILFEQDIQCYILILEHQLWGGHNTANYSLSVTILAKNHRRFIAGYIDYIFALIFSFSSH
jgi:hypothetical protein